MKYNLKHEDGTMKLPIRRLLENTEHIPGSLCWAWTGTKNSYGYGVISIKGKIRMAHRAAYELFTFKNIDNMQLDHLCRNRGCINPNHLEIVTLKENILRGKTCFKKRSHCKNGHARTSENIWQKINEDGLIERSCRVCAKLRKRKQQLMPARREAFCEARRRHYWKNK